MAGVAAFSHKPNALPKTARCDIRPRIYSYLTVPPRTVRYPATYHFNVLVPAADGHQDLTDVHASAGAGSLAERATHACLEPISSSA